ncbi:alpha/beta hydrolase, partial [Lutimaribacter sp. EGI FJ00014]|nr:alpha/beta hydrolase [Lutimaribacter sp. EGI FJ00014]
EFYLRSKLAAWGKSGSEVFMKEAVAEYCRAFRDPACIAATCEDYRAAASIDLEHDLADAHRRIEMPLLVLWGTKGLVGRLYDVVSVWREKASNVTGRGLSV